MKIKNLLLIGIFMSLISCADNNLDNLGSEVNDSVVTKGLSWCDPDETDVTKRRIEHNPAPGLHITEYTDDMVIRCFITPDNSHYRDYDFPEHPGNYHYPDPETVVKYPR